MRRLLRTLFWMAVLLGLLWAGIDHILRTLPPLEEGREALWEQLDELSRPWAFDFNRWEMEALWRKGTYALLAPQRWMDEPTRARFVLAYLDDVREAHRHVEAINRAYADPDVADPRDATAQDRAALARLREKLDWEAPVAEAILGEQVSVILHQEGGFGVAGQVLPPVSGTFTPLPNVLVISWRTKIERIYQRDLITGLTDDDRDRIERKIETAKPHLSAYVTEIGGLSAYPAMLYESSDLDWDAETMAHEWTHHYLDFHPLGWAYGRSFETTTMNETTASLVGEWAGQEVVRRFYAPLLHREKPLPHPLVAPPKEPGEERRFDFRAEMHRTRVTVDRLLAEGKVEVAEIYMELQRRYFVDQGYRIRRLNQAYFAFHGAYAESGGASGEDPTGPLVRRLWAISPTPQAFVHRIAPLTERQQLEALFADAPAP